MADGETDDSTGETIKVVAQMVVFTLIILATIVGNSLICLSVTKFRHLRTNTNFILLSLALTDLGMVVIMVWNSVYVLHCFFVKRYRAFAYGKFLITLTEVLSALLSFHNNIQAIY